MFLNLIKNLLIKLIEKNKNDDIENTKINNFNKNDITSGNISKEVIVSNNTILNDYSIGDLAIKYETGNKGVKAVEFISNGASWDPGGTSYGPYQLETNKGTMQEYLKQKDKYTTELKKYKINTEDFKSCWRALAKQDPKGFQQSQFNYLCNKPNGYNEAIAYAKKLGWAVDSFALQSAIFSTSNESGGWKKGIFDKTGIKSTDNIETQINKLYNARANYFRKLDLRKDVKKNILLNRTDETLDGKRSVLNTERDDCLKLIGVK